MHFSKLRISTDATSKLRTLRQRTGITPNLLCRYALISSLEEGAIGNSPLPDEDGQEFNAYTLTGDQNELFFAAILHVEDPVGDLVISDSRALELLRCHIQRGTGYLSVRVKGPSDLLELREPNNE
ncbi:MULTISPECIES: DNA sulfur modification protein DndE [Pseudomonas syringae group]|uniref:DNA sulfur modification protein DndE n=1 Tax=Pseudomonas syringae group TaxID=136849 RepID=UPI000EFE1A22|nr:DNA sulfur modification protein DndE [Pseudomonas cichorii]MBX8587464.1 DNA sulfur modification protein DndE [Pseudomonas cichorii]